MQFLSGANLQPAISSLQGHVANSLATQITPQQSKIAFIAAAILASLVAFFLYFTSCFRRQEAPAQVIQQSTQTSTTTERVEEVVQTTPPLEKIKSPSAQEQPEQKETIPSEKKETEQQHPIPARFKEIKRRVAEKAESAVVAEERNDSEIEPDFEFEWTEDDFAFSTEDSEDYLDRDEDSYEFDDTPKKASEPKQKYYLDGKECSLRTLKCRDKLMKTLSVIDKELGKAEDNGDCFYGSWAQAISKHLGQQVTKKEIREKISAEVKKLDQGPVSENWIKSLVDYGGIDTYEDYRDRVALTCEEILAQKLPSPIWGIERRDGVILCRLYQVNLQVYEAGPIQDDPKKYEDDDNYFTSDGPTQYPESEHYPHNIEMAMWPGHFMPVWNKVEHGN